MGERATIDQDYLYDIADAIRAKKGVETQYLPSQMKAAILSIDGGATLITKTITQNGTYDAEDDDADGYSSVTVNVSGGGGTTCLCEIDFTKVLSAFTYKHVQINSSGAVFTRNDNYIPLPFAYYGSAIEVDIVETDMSNATNNRFITADDTNHSLCYHKDPGKWSIYNGSSWEDSNISDKHYFDGSTVKIVTDSNHKWHIYKDGVLIWEPSLSITMNGLWTIGSSSNAIDGAIISGIRVY